MKKLEKIKNREAARVLVCQALGMIELAKDKLLDIDGDPNIINWWKDIQNRLWDFHVDNCDKARLEEKKKVK